MEKQDILLLDIPVNEFDPGLPKVGRTLSPGQVARITTSAPCCSALSEAHLRNTPPEVRELLVPTACSFDQRWVFCISTA